MNITKILNDYLLENVLTDISIIYNDLFPEDTGDSLISRYDPSQANEKTYIDGSSQGMVQIAYYMRSDDAENCRNVLLSIVEALDDLKLVDTDGTEINAEAQTLPSFVSVDDKGAAIYTIEINVRYLRPGKE